jgi:hypothetical protein
MSINSDRYSSGNQDESVCDNSFESFRNQSASGHLLVQKIEDRSLDFAVSRDHWHERLRVSPECSLAIKMKHNFLIDGFLQFCRHSWCTLHDENRHSICLVSVDSLVDKTTLTHAQARRLIRTRSGLAEFIKSVDRYVLPSDCHLQESDIKIPIAYKSYLFLRDRCPEILRCFAHGDHSQEIRDAIRFVEAEGRPFLLHRRRYPFLPRSVLITSDRNLIILFNRSSKGDRKEVEERSTKWLGYNVTEGREVRYISGYSGCDKGEDCVRHFDRSLSNVSLAMDGSVRGSFLIKKTPEKPEGRYISIAEIPQDRVSFPPGDDDIDL